MLQGFWYDFHLPYPTKTGDHHHLRLPTAEAQSLRAQSEKKANLAAASRKRPTRNGVHAFLNRPSAPVSKVPALKEPTLSKDFVRRIDALDERLHKRGVAVSREWLLSLGQKRFQELLALDRTTRSLQRVIRSKTDLTDWRSVEYTFQLANALVTPVPRRKIAEQVSGAGLDRDEAAKIAGFPDLWKATVEQPTVRNVYAFHDAFVSLVLGQSMLQRLSSDGRLRSSFFCGGKGGKVDLIREWLAVLEGAHFTVTLTDPLWNSFAWLCAERTPLPKPAELTNEWLGVRVPSANDIRFAQAVLHGFLLGYSSWALWDYVGRATRKATDVELLETWRKELARRYPAITAFHNVLSGYFHREVGSGMYAHRQFDDAGYRIFIEGAARKLTRSLTD